MTLKFNDGPLAAGIVIAVDVRTRIFDGDDVRDARHVGRGTMRLRRTTQTYM